MRKNEFLCFLLDQKINKDEDFPFASEYLSRNHLDSNLLDYLLFLKNYLIEYRKRYRNGDKSFKEFLNSVHPPAVEEEKITLKGDF